MSERRWLAELDEHDRDLYEAEKAYERWLSGQPEPDVATSEQAFALAAECYDPDLDDPNGWLGADERERDVKGEH